jgi:hypothetical protein
MLFRRLIGVVSRAILEDHMQADVKITIIDRAVQIAWGAHGKENSPWFAGQILLARIHQFLAVGLGRLIQRKEDVVRQHFDFPFFAAGLGHGQ